MTFLNGSVAGAMGTSGLLNMGFTLHIERERNTMRNLTIASIFIIISVTASCTKTHQNKADKSQTQLTAQEVSKKLLNGEWIGPAISYSGYRDGQSPDMGVYPSLEQIL